MTSDNVKLSLIKEQLEKMIETIQNMDGSEKNEAYSYLREFLDNGKRKSEDINPTNGDNDLTTNSITQMPRKTSRKIKYSNPTSILKKSVLKCRVCGVLSKSKRVLLQHLECHIGTPITCLNCKRHFNSRPSYLCHLSLKMCMKRKNVLRHVCSQCQKTFRFKRHFERHMEGHKRNNCTYCDAPLTRRKQLAHHLLTVHSIKLERAVLHKCEYCEKRYVKKRSLYHHLKQHADNKIVCMECGRMSLTLDAHIEHSQQHDLDRPWKCYKCTDRFSRHQQYLIHMKRHDRYKCLTCSESFASKAYVLKHKRCGHVVQGLESQLKCPYCPMAFQRRLTLQMHLKKHSDDKSMFCKYCEKKFRSPYLYYKHCMTTIHDINSPTKQKLVCEMCGKVFMKKYLLEQHLHRVHNKTKQVYNCKFCSHKSTNKKNMERHFALHFEDKKEFVCDKCGKTFYNITTLKDHVSYVHSQERVFQCTQCDKAFKRNSELIRHKTSHSELRPHVCKTCGVSYKRSTHLRRHEESQHGTVKTNRRVQRLTKNVDGTLVPVLDQKSKGKTKAKPKDNPVKQAFNIMNMHSGQLVTYSIPDATETTNLSVFDINNLNIQDVDAPHQPIWSNTAQFENADQIFANQVLNYNINGVNSVDQNFGVQSLNIPSSSTFLINNAQLKQSHAAVTCDVLLPDRVSSQ